MKIAKVIFFILISTLCFNCAKKCPPSPFDILPPVLHFSIIDSEGNDLFFGENNIYDPNSVKIVTEQNEGWLGIDEWEKCFRLGIIKGKTSIFYVEFIPNRIDTIKIESCFLHWYEEPKGCRHFGIYKDDVFFNNIPICTDCSGETYKIEIK